MDSPRDMEHILKIFSTLSKLRNSIDEKFIYVEREISTVEENIYNELLSEIKSTLLSDFNFMFTYLNLTYR